MFTYISSLSASERQVFQIFDHFRSIHVVSLFHCAEPLDITNLAQNGADDDRPRMTDSKCREGPGKEVAVVATGAGFVRRSGTREGSVGLIWHLHSCSLQKCPILKSKSLPLYFIPTYVKYSSFHRPECQLNFRKLLRWLSPAKLEFLRLWRKGYTSISKNLGHVVTTEIESMAKWRVYYTTGFVM